MKLTPVQAETLTMMGEGAVLERDDILRRFVGIRSDRMGTSPPVHGRTVNGLEKKGLIRIKKTAKFKTYILTPRGRQEVKRLAA